MVIVGDGIPSINLVEGAPDATVDLSQELASGSGIIIGVPAAFSPTCSDSHIPEFLAHPKLKSAGKVFVVSVNDAFVMKAWGKSLDKDASSGVRFLGDPAGKFTRALDLEFEAAPLLGTNRSKRYAIVVEGGKVKSINVEPDNIGTAVSTAGKVLG
ncbi:probable peroxiredoxin-5, mitochondrial precursor [Rhynchosporium agropyri]|uniref:Probable peroxiredoxin-5, mitochondrial n=1 Tax=Rhynchosporium agropyri TaxID=914238 RepID=A0A1E1KAE2_9HELO|nr:probable peroxiredoxin-5, mitochondrial precursor [Rhynchosporium agropyri]